MEKGFTYNITFVADPTREEDLVSFIRDNLIQGLFSAWSQDIFPSVKKIVEAGGEKPGPEHGVSFALAANFDSEEKARLWHDHILLPALRNYNRLFGKESLFFITLLENVL